MVLQEIFGVNAHIRSVADGFARAGYLAVAPALFHRVRADVELGYGDADRALGMVLKSEVESLPVSLMQADIQSVVDFAARACGGRVAVVGYCWGGLWAWRSAAWLKGVSAAVSYYGGGMTVGTEAGRSPGCPVQAHFAEQDRWIPLDSVHAFQEAHPETRVHIYPADHGFNCDQRSAWHAPSALLAQQRTLSFLADHVG